MLRHYQDGGMPTHLGVRQLACPSRSSLGSQTAASFDFTGFFIEFAATHLLLDATSLYQFSESSDRLLNRFTVSYQQLYHTVTIPKFTPSRKRLSSNKLYLPANRKTKRDPCPLSSCEKSDFSSSVGVRLGLSGTFFGLCLMKPSSLSILGRNLLYSACPTLVEIDGLKRLFGHIRIYS